MDLMSGINPAKIVYNNVMNKMKLQEDDDTKVKTTGLLKRTQPESTNMSDKTHLERVHRYVLDIRKQINGDEV